MTRKTVLVTGGAGYVGSHTCKALARAGFTPVTFDNLEAGHAWAVKWGPLVRGDIADRLALAEAFRRYRPQAVLHFAASASVGESVADPGKYYHNNAVGTLNVIEAALEFGRPPIVFSSTCATYGVPQATPIPETHAQTPISPYGASKLMAERMLADFGAAHGLRWIVLRYFNAAGADPDGDTGEAHQPETHLVPLVLKAAAGLAPHVTILGDDYPTPDGTCVRDYVHVSDLANGHVCALEALVGGQASGAFNLGTGRGVSVREVIQCARRVTGRPIAERVAARRPGDPPVLICDATLARQVLGWAPRFGDIHDIIATAWAWHMTSGSLGPEWTAARQARVA